MFGYSNNNDSDDLFGIDTTTALSTSDRCENDFAFADPSALAYNWLTDEMYLVTDKTTAISEPTMRIFSDTTFDQLSCDVTEVEMDISDIENNSACTLDCAEDQQSMSFSTEDNLFYVYSKVALQYYSVTPTAPFTAILISEGTTQRGLGFALSTGVGSPPIFETQVPEQFAQADSIALTVLGVLPVVLFFALFTVLSPRVDGEQ